MMTGGRTYDLKHSETGDPRARPLYKWHSSASTACADARGRRVVLKERLYNTCRGKEKEGVHTHGRLPTCLQHT